MTMSAVSIVAFVPSQPSTNINELMLVATPRDVAGVVDLHVVGLADDLSADNLVARDVEVGVVHGPSGSTAALAVAGGFIVKVSEPGDRERVLLVDERGEADVQELFWTRRGNPFDVHVDETTGRVRVIEHLHDGRIVCHIGLLDHPVNDLGSGRSCAVGRDGSVAFVTDDGSTLRLEVYGPESVGPVPDGVVRARDAASTRHWVTPSLGWLIYERVLGERVELVVVDTTDGREQFSGRPAERIEEVIVAPDGGSVAYLTTSVVDTVAFVHDGRREREVARGARVAIAYADDARLVVGESSRDDTWDRVVVVPSKTGDGSLVPVEVARDVHDWALLPGTAEILIRERAGRSDLVIAGPDQDRRVVARPASDDLRAFGATVGPRGATLLTWIGADGYGVSFLPGEPRGAPDLGPSDHDRRGSGGATSTGNAVDDALGSVGDDTTGEARVSSVSRPRSVAPPLLSGWHQVAASLLHPNWGRMVVLGREFPRDDYVLAMADAHGTAVHPLDRMEDAQSLAVLPDGRLLYSGRFGPSWQDHQVRVVNPDSRRTEILHRDAWLVATGFGPSSWAPTRGFTARQVTVPEQCAGDVVGTIGVDDQATGSLEVGEQACYRWVTSELTNLWARMDASGLDGWLVVLDKVGSAEYAATWTSGEWDADVEAVPYEDYQYLVVSRDAPGSGGEYALRTWREDR
ncbi:MAG: hypothetical protein WD007_02825 [Nitriliruptoraceae bacterium]